MYSATITVTDDGTGLLTDSETITITVNEVNTDPVLDAIGNQSVDELVTLLFTATASDADLPAETLSFSLDATSLANGMTINAVSGAFSWTPSEAQGPGPFSATITVTDDGTGTLSDSETITVTVNEVNEAPMITSSSNASVTENQTGVIDVDSSDPDGETENGGGLTYSKTGGADQPLFSLDTATGVLTFLAAPDFENPSDIGTNNVYDVQVSVTDAGLLTDVQDIAVTVTDVTELDFGDAPDTAVGTSSGNYNTLLTDNGPRHTVVTGLFLGGVTVDGDDGTLQNITANADDVDGALPDDENGLNNPIADLNLTVGTVPTVNVIVTNTTGSGASLFGWIDTNNDGVFENATERASVAVPTGTNSGIVTLTFPTVPAGFTGTTYARFRLSTDVAAADPTGAAGDGEVEDYIAAIVEPSSGFVKNFTKIASGAGGGPTLDHLDQFGTSVTAVGDLDGDGVTDLAVGATGDDTGGDNRGAVYVLFMNAAGSVNSSSTIASDTNGGPTLTNSDFFGTSVTAVCPIWPLARMVMIPEEVPTGRSMCCS
jgi:hypothetical protein